MLHDSHSSDSDPSGPEDIALTDYPEVDIKTHREIAAANKLLSAMIVAFGFTALMEDLTDMGVGLILLSYIGFRGALHLEAEADEWE